MCLPLIGALVSVAGTVAGAAGQYSQAKAQQAFANRQAEIEAQKGAYENARLKEQNTKSLAKMRGQYLSSGISLEGSAGEVIADSAQQASLDEQAVLYGSNIKRDNYRWEGQMAGMNARQAVIGGVIGSLSPLVNMASGSMTGSANRTMINNPYVSRDPWKGLR